MDDWKEILEDNAEQLSDEDMLKYLDENTPEEEKYTIEKKIAGSSFENDAVEGLQKIEQPGRLQKHVKNLNQKLYQQLAKRKQRKEKEKVISFRWILLAILLLLFICIAGFLFIRMNDKSLFQHNTTGKKTEQNK